MTPSVHCEPGASEEPLRVLLVCWAPFHAGAEVAALRLADGLRQAGHAVHLIVGTEGETLARARQLDLPVQFIPLATTDRFRWWKFERAQREVRRAIRAFRPDLAHANDLPTSQMAGRTCRREGIPLVCHHRWVFGGEAIAWLDKFGADRHVFVSDALRRELTAASPKLAAAPCTVVHDGLPLPTLPSDDDRAAARRRLELPSETRLVLLAGQVIERKGVGDLLHAWSQLPQGAQNAAVLAIVGDDLENAGAYRRQMEQLAGQLGVQPLWAGFRRDVADWIVAADVCVVPSHVEPLGNATLEAMALGRPVIGTRVGGIPEMVADGETGLLTAPRQPAELAAALQRLLADEPWRRRLGVAARRRCEERFSLDRHVAAMVEQYRAALPVAAASA